MAVSGEYFRIDGFAFPDSSLSYFGITEFAYSEISPLTGAGPDELGFALAGPRAQGYSIAGMRSQGYALAGPREQGATK